jgi:hypothetical protein
MSKRHFILSLALAASFLFSSLPVLACAMPCSMGKMAAAAHGCCTHMGGQAACHGLSLNAACCCKHDASVVLGQAAPGALQKAFVPAAFHFALAPTAVTAFAGLAGLAVAQPFSAANAYLQSHHPLANAPPSFV